MGELHSLTLDDLMSRLGTTLLPTLIQQAEMIVTVNWTMMPLVGEFWRYLLQNTQFFTQGPRKSLFVDLADPAKRSVADLKKNLNSLSKLSTYCNVILSLNRSESDQVLQALCLSSTPSIQKNAEKIAVALGISSVVIHTHHDVACALLSKESIISESLRVSVVKNPVRSTGAGDTFNAGFLAGILRHQSPFVCLKAGVAASRVLVRTGITPTSDQVFN